MFCRRSAVVVTEWLPGKLKPWLFGIASPPPGPARRVAVSDGSICNIALPAEDRERLDEIVARRNTSRSALLSDVLALAPVVMTGCVPARPLTERCPNEARIPGAHIATRPSDRANLNAASVSLCHGDSARPAGGSKEAVAKHARYGSRTGTSVASATAPAHRRGGGQRGSRLA
jgi:hypothetical protein